jgi:galactose mutarotase-like enzyme
MDSEPFGETELGPVDRITIGAAPGPRLRVLDLGATVQTLEIQCGDGVRRNVVLGHPTAQDYLDSTHYIGAAIGRYANRIAGGRFTLDGVPVQVGVHDRGNHLHGGPDGFDRRTWEVVDRDESSVTFRLHSTDGDQGFPGNVTAEVRYTVLDDGVRIDFTATTDAPTVVNLTSHAYFNLSGEGTGTAEDHLLQVDADHYLPVDETGVPPGGLAPVAGTPFDLRTPTVVADAVRTAHPELRASQGIDHNYAPEGQGLRRVAVLEAPRTRTRMELFSDQPGLQVYTGNFLDGTVPGTGAALYRQGDGIALEPQLFPDSPNHAEFASPVLRAGETYSAAMQWRFSAAPGRGRVVGG